VNDAVFQPAALIASKDTPLSRNADTALGEAPVLIGQFQLQISDGIAPAVPPDSNFNGNPLSNVGVITGPGAQSRPAVAVDPIIPTRIAVAANDYATRTVRVSTSQDGGATWHVTTLSRTVLNQNFVTAANPSLAFDSLGRLSVAYTLANPFDSANALVISESSDGVNFNPPMAITFHPASERVIDSRPVIAINRRVGRFVAWDSLSLMTSLYSINVARSPEGGLFGPVTTVVNGAQVSSPALALGKKVVYVAWDEWGFNSSPPYNAAGRLMIASSAVRKDHSDDDEESRGSHREESSDSRFKFGKAREIARTSIGFGQRIAAMPEMGAGPNLGLAVDPKKEDIVYATFVDRYNGMDIRFARSRDGGNKWEVKSARSKARIGAVTVNNDGTGADQFSPAMTVDAAGNISISFYDTQLSSAFETAHVFVARSLDGGESFDNRRITTASSNDSKSNPLRDFTANLGDRTGIAATSGNPVVVWTDTRSGSEDVFLSVIDVSQ